MPASSFDGVNIRVELDSATSAAPTWSRPSYRSVRHVPASNTDIIQVLGLGHGVVTHRLLLDADEWTALQAKQLETGDLIVAGVSQGDALLEELPDPIRHIRGWVTVQATFRKTAAG